MRRFLYFIPGVGGANPKMLADRGFLDRFIGATGELMEHCVASIMEGPAGSGCIVCAGSNPPEYSINQRWIEGEKFWVGIETMPPGPDDLVREVGIAGYEVQLGDGNAWRCPCIRRWDVHQLEHVANVPKRLTRVIENGTAKLEHRIYPQYAAVDELAGSIWKAFVNESSVPLDVVFADAVKLLAVNYRIGVEEVSLLGLLDGPTAVRIAELSIDLPVLQEQANANNVDGLVVTDPLVEQTAE